MNRLALTAVLGCALVGLADANGRAPGTSTIHFRPDSTNDVWLGLTFGEVVSHDGGKSWRWMCENAVGYSGTYDPVLAYSRLGALFATSFGGLPGKPGLTVTRDGCSFTSTPLGNAFVSQVVIGPDATVYATASSPSDSKLYQSRDDGVSFGTSSSPGKANDWWQSLTVAPADASAVFLSGYRFVSACDHNSPRPFAMCSEASQCQDSTHPTGGCEGQELLLLLSSRDHGRSWQPLPGHQMFRTATDGVGLATSTASVLDFVGTSNDGGTLYLRVTQENAKAPSDGLYELATGLGRGRRDKTDAQWKHVLSLDDSMAVLVQPSGDVVVGTKSVGAQLLRAGASAWTRLPNAPHINCLAENLASHEVWACTQNYSVNQSQGDGYGVMKTSDLATWTGVLRYQDIAGPVACDASTIQQTQCVLPAVGKASAWCALRTQLSVTANPLALNGSACASSDGSGTVSGKRSPAPAPPKRPGGCCDAAAGDASPLVGLLWLRCFCAPRRRRLSV